MILLDAQSCMQNAICFPLGEITTRRDTMGLSRPGLLVPRSRVRFPPGSFPYNHVRDSPFKAASLSGSKRGGKHGIR